MLSADWHACDHSWLRRLDLRHHDAEPIYRCCGCGYRLLPRELTGERQQAAMRRADAEWKREASGDAPSLNGRGIADGS